MTNKIYIAAQEQLKSQPKKWLVTGAAGFIGSHLVRKLLLLDQTVVGLDDFSTGKQSNLDEVKAETGDKWKNFSFSEADIRDQRACIEACSGVELVLHQAALGSVPRSIKNPLTTHAVNVTGFINILLAAKEASVKRVVYASSSSVYGDSEELPKVEDIIGKQLSPYAVSKYSNELYAHVFALSYGMELIGLRYFNVFGPRQDPEGQYAAVIPRWFAALMAGTSCVIFGDGETSRDFCFIENVVQANLLSALADKEEAVNRVYNIAVGERTTLNELHSEIKKAVVADKPEISKLEPKYEDFRAGDVKHSLADISNAKQYLGYQAEFNISEGLQKTFEWFNK